MISKNSFWVRVKQNAKRRNWCYFTSTITLFLFLPIALLIFMSGVVNSGYMKEEESKQLYETAMSWIGMKSLISFVVIVLAMIATIQGFSYLHNRKKVDMYHSQPVSNRQRYFAIYLNGIIAFILPYIVNVILSVMIAGSYGVADGRMIETALFAMLLNICLYLAVYAVVITVVMLTGNRITAILGSITALLYGTFLNVVFDIYKQCYFMTALSDGSMDEIADEMLFKCSVIGFLDKMSEFYVHAIKEQESAIEIAKVFRSLYFGTIIIAVVFTVFSYFLYCRRKAESAENAMAFPVTKEIIEFMVGIPAALLCGIIVGDTSGGGTVAFVLGTILGMILAHIVIQLIYEADISQVFAKWRTMAVGMICALAVFLLFYSDLLGYDSYVPKESELVSAAFSLTDNYYIDLDKDSATNYTVLYAEDYLLEEMCYTDIDNIMALARANIFVKEKSDLFGHSKLVKEMKGGNDYWSNYDSDYIAIKVSYRFKDGSEKKRRLYINKEENSELLEKLVSSQEYKEAYFQICDERILSKSNEYPITITIEDSFGTYEVDDEWKEGLIAAYRKDIAQYTYEMAQKEYPLAAMRIYMDEYNNWPYYECYIYQEFTETLEYLKEHAIYEPVQQENLNVKFIEIRLYNEAEDSIQKQMKYIEEEQVKQILDVLDMSLSYSDMISKSNSEMEIVLNDNDGNSYLVYVKEGKELPDFVKKDFSIETTEE